MTVGRSVRIAVWSSLGAALAFVAYLLINTTFMAYDDEGYLLISLRNYLSGLRLYDDVFSQYGPWPYVYHQLITSALQLPMTHMLGRAITIFHWVGSALLCGMLARQLTNRLVIGLATTVATFGLCWQMTSEPSHPGSHIALLVALAAIGASRLAAATRPAVWFALLGALIALLCLTKINVGLLLVAGLGCVALRYTAWPAAWQRPAAAAAAAALVAMPWVLVGRQLDHAGVLILALQCSAAAAGLLWISPPAWAARLPSGRSWLVLLASAGATAVAVCAVVIGRGTSPAALLDAILISPLRLPARFLIELRWGGAVWPVTVACWLLTARAGWEMRDRGVLASRTCSLLVAARFAGLLVFAWNAQSWLTFAGVSRFIVFCLPLLPVYVVPLRARTPERGPHFFAVWAAAFVALPQVLHAFPVAGSQMAWGTFLFVPLLAVGLAEAWAWLDSRVPGRRHWAVPAGEAVLVCLTLFQLATLAHTGWERYQGSRPLDLPGAEDVRVDGRTRQALRLLTLNAEVQCDLLFSRQGMFSYNLWSEVPSPTTHNATHWFWLLDDARQREIIGRLAGTPRNAIIISHPLDDLLAQLKVPVEGPLQSFITQRYRPLFEYQGFAFLVPNDSHLAPFGLVEVLQARGADATGRPPVLLRTNLVLDGKPAAFRLENLDAPWATVADYLAGPNEIYAEPINRAGETVGVPVSLPAAAPLRGLFRLSIFCPAAPSGQTQHRAVLVVRDPTGAILSESNF